MYVYMQLQVCIHTQMLISLHAYSYTWPEYIDKLVC